jgi:large subunit ribosomal protein L7/L12
LTIQKEVKNMTDKKESAKLESKSVKSKVSKAVEKLVDEIAKLTVMELSDLVNALQDKLGVTAAAPVAATVAPAAEAEAADAGAAAGGGSATQTVVITAAGDNKISVIKAIREVDQNIGLKEAKDMTENLPAEVLKDAKADDAKEAAEKLKVAGATVELK